jgi:hypothetical protein
MLSENISINRAPVLILWATVVAVQLGFKENEALSFAKKAGWNDRTGAPSRSR